MTITTEEAKKLKLELEIAVFKLCEAYTEKTGLVITDISLSHESMVNLGNPRERRKVLADVRAEVQL